MSQDEQTGTGDECTQDKLLGKPECKLPETDSRLQAVLDAWPTLPEHIRKAILALIGAADQP